MENFQPNIIPGWFARDPVILKRVGKVLLQLQTTSVKPDKIFIPEDCFKLLSFPGDQLSEVLSKSMAILYGRDTIQCLSLGNYIKDKVSSLKHFIDVGTGSQEYNISSLAALSSAMRLLQKYEFKKNHGEWVSTVKPNLGPGISERVWEALETTDERINFCLDVKTELYAALTALLGAFGILALPTVPGPPPKLKTEPSSLEIFRAKAFSLLSIAGVSGFCQVSIPLGMHENLPISISLLAKHGSDGFLLNVVESVYATLKEQFETA